METSAVSTGGVPGPASNDLSRGHRLLPQRRTNLLQSRRRILEHQVGGQPQHAVTEALQRVDPTRIKVRARRMVTAIDLDRQARRRCDEVCDEPPQRHLTPKANTELPRAQEPPQRLLRAGGRSARGQRALAQDLTTNSWNVKT